MAVSATDILAYAFGVFILTEYDSIATSLYIKYLEFDDQSNHTQDNSGSDWR